jgi:hypothetical protein
MATPARRSVVRSALVVVGLLALGAAAGWLARGWLDEAETPTRLPTAPERTPSGPSEPRLEPRHPEAAAPPARDPGAADAEPPLAVRVAEGSADDLRRLEWDVDRASAGAPWRPDAAAIDALVERLARSVETGQADVFLAVVRLLGAADDPRGDAALVRLLEDVALPLPDRACTAFEQGLGDATAPGVVSAVRARAEADRARGGSDREASGWFGLVARLGSHADHDWLLARATEWEATDRAMEVLVASGRPEALERVRQIFRSGRAEGIEEAVGGLARQHPEEAWALALEVARLRGVEAMDHWAHAAPEGHLSLLEDHLRALRDEGERISAVGLVGTLEERGRDVSGFRSILDAPVELIERVAAGDVPSGHRRSLLNQAGYAIEYHRALWTERAARALEAAAQTLQRERVIVGGPDYQHVARLVRAGLADPWD